MVSLDFGSDLKVVPRAYSTPLLDGSSGRQPTKRSRRNGNGQCVSGHAWVNYILSGKTLILRSTICTSEYKASGWQTGASFSQAAKLYQTETRRFYELQLIVKSAGDQPARAARAALCMSHASVE